MKSSEEVEFAIVAPTTSESKCLGQAAASTHPDLRMGLGQTFVYQQDAGKPQNAFTTYPNGTEQDDLRRTCSTSSLFKSCGETNWSARFESVRQIRYEELLTTTPPRVTIRVSTTSTAYESGSAQKRSLSLQQEKHMIGLSSRYSSSNLAEPECHQPVFLQPPMLHQSSFASTTSSSGRRKIRLQLREEVARGGLGMKNYDQFSSVFFSGTENLDSIPRGCMNASWFEGTTSIDLLEHVRKSLIRKLKLEKHIQIRDLRFVDESSEPAEEVVLSACIPDGSELTLLFTLDDSTSDVSVISAMNSLPEATSLEDNQFVPPKIPSELKLKNSKSAKKWPCSSIRQQIDFDVLEDFSEDNDDDEELDNSNDDLDSTTKATSVYELRPEDREDSIEALLTQINTLLANKNQSRTKEKPEKEGPVIFMLSNYFILLVCFMAIVAELQARTPHWLLHLQKQMQSVQDCAADKEALFQCVSNGDFAGLVASVIIWLNRSAAARSVVLLGFETPHKLLTVLYESFISAICGGFSYLFIQRAMNPDTRFNCFRKYWKDAIYGSLAGFNAAFLKQVLKHWIPDN